MRFRRFDLLLDGNLKAAIKKHRVVVASGAPFAALGAAELLHMKDAGAIELIVERSEVVHGAFPLLVNILVAFAALRRFHEEIGGHDAADAGARGRWPEGGARAFSFFCHRDGDDFRIHDAVLGEAESQCRGYES